jgi:BASS family bile acid:Na+ symporter
MTLSRMFPGLALRVRKPFKIFTLIFFIIILCGAFAANWKIFLEVMGLVVFVVFIHNAMALNLGYWSGRLVRLPEADCRAVSIEVGIQNAALGLVLVFTFFQGMGGMAIVVGWWGIWHIVAGLITAFIFTRRRLPGDEEAANNCKSI